MSNKRAIDLSGQYFELLNDSIPYHHQVEALLPVLKRLGYDRAGAESALKEWALQDKAMLYWMGCCCSSDIEAMWLLVQAGRLLCDSVASRNNTTHQRKTPQKRAQS
jgi:hypothetical protein